MRINSDNIEPMQPIPEEFAFGKPGPNGAPMVFAANRNPHLAWTDVPQWTRSFVLMCVDADVPASGDDVNKAGRHVAASLARVEFFHWVMIDIPLECRELGTASCADGVVPHGRQDPFGPPGSKQGINDFTGWFSGDAAMSGDYYGYDGPCPPWNEIACITIISAFMRSMSRRSAFPAASPRATYVRRCKATCWPRPY